MLWDCHANQALLGFAEIAVAWVLRHPAVTGTIVGMRRPDQVTGVVGAADFRLTPEVIAEIDGLLAKSAI